MATNVEWNDRENEHTYNKYKVFVGNLGFGVTVKALKENMEKFGEVIRADIFTRPDGKSKGSGIVEFATKRASLKAVEENQKMNIEGRLVFIRADRRARRKGFSSGFNIYVGNLPWSVVSEELKDTFKEYGNILGCDVPTRWDGRSKGYGLISYESKTDAIAAIEAMNETKIHDRKVLVRWDRKD